MSRLKTLLLLLFFYSYLFSEDLDNYEVITVVSSTPKTSNDIIIAVDKINRDFLDRNDQPQDKPYNKASFKDKWKRSSVYLIEGFNWILLLRDSRPNDFLNEALLLKGAG